MLHQTFRHVQGGLIVRNLKSAGLSCVRQIDVFLSIHHRILPQCAAMGVGYYGLSVTLVGLVSGVVLFNRAKRFKTKAQELQDEVEGGRQLADDISAEADRQLAAYRCFHEQSVSQLQVC